ncbi:MAG: arginase family protein [Glutamicibacter ardleyensis]
MQTKNNTTNDVEWVWHPALFEQDSKLLNPAEGSSLELNEAVLKLRARSSVARSELNPEVFDKLSRRRFLIPKECALVATHGLLKSAQPVVEVECAQHSTPWGLIGAGVWQNPDPDLAVHDVLAGLRRGLQRSLAIVTSANSWNWNEMSTSETYPCRVVDHGNLIVDSRIDTAQDIASRLLAATRTVGAQGHNPVVIGGDHSIAYPVISAQRERWQQLVVVHLDAHANARPIPHGQQTADCGNFVTWCLADEPDLPWLTLGVRGYDPEFSMPSPLTAKHVSFIKASDLGSKQCFDEIEQHCQGRPVHLSIDIDVLDPVFAPEVAYPAIGGADPDIIKEIINRIRSSGTIVGVDFTEVCGPMTRRNLAAMYAIDMLTHILTPKRTIS